MLQTSKYKESVIIFRTSRIIRYVAPILAIGFCLSVVISFVFMVSTTELANDDNRPDLIDNSSEDE